MKKEEVVNMMYDLLETHFPGDFESQKAFAGEFGFQLAPKETPADYPYNPLCDMVSKLQNFPTQDVPAPVPVIVKDPDYKSVAYRGRMARKLGVRSTITRYRTLSDGSSEPITVALGIHLVFPLPDLICHVDEKFAASQKNPDGTPMTLDELVKVIENHAEFGKESGQGGFWRLSEEERLHLESKPPPVNKEVQRVSRGPVSMGTARK
jgi:hypothetical protein